MSSEQTVTEQVAEQFQTMGLATQSDRQAFSFGVDRSRPPLVVEQILSNTSQPF
jgi:hypothetical protein